MQLRLALVVLLVGCGSVSVPMSGDDGGGGGGIDAPVGPPDANPNVVAELGGVWDVTIEDEPLCTATFTSTLLVECVETSMPDTTNPGCVRTTTLRIAGSWEQRVTFLVEGLEDYTGCNPTYLNTREEVAHFDGTRTSGMPSPGLWAAVGGTWTVDGFEPMETMAALTCVAEFMPAAALHSVRITCETPWTDSNSDGCETRATYSIPTSFDGNRFDVSFLGQDESRGTPCVPPLIEPWEPASLIAVKR
jgi:hypothetical protein